LRKLLRLSAFGALLGASAVAALLPDWATTLKAQAYASYIDLHLGLDANADVARAGGTLRVAATVYNGGSVDAHHVHTDAQLQPVSIGLTTFGCGTDPSGYPTCLFAAPLAPDAAIAEVLLLDVPPQARGTLSLQMQASADEPEGFPGQESAALLLPIEAHVDLATQLHCARAAVQRDMALACGIVVSNAGPASALQAQVHFAADGASVSNVVCHGTNPSACPPAAVPFGDWSIGELRAGDVMRVDFTLTLPSSYPADQATLAVDIAPNGGEIEDAPDDNGRTLDIAVPLFADGFEAPPN